MNRAELVKTLELVKPALATTNMVPIFQSFIFNNGTVAAYDDNIAIVGPTEFEEICGLNGNVLVGLLSNSGAEEIDIQLDDGVAHIKLGKTVSKLPFAPYEDSIFREPDDKWAFKIPFTESLFDALTLCLETVSVDATQAALMGITVQGDKMYSCNSDALTRIQLKHGTGKNRVLMSTPFCSAVIKLWSTLKITKGSLNFSDDWVYANFEDWSVYGRILEVSDPIDFEALIKKTIKAKTPVQAVPEAFAGALSRARVLSDPESCKTVIEVSKGKLKLHTETHMGEIRDEMLLKGHPDVDANVNASHLQKAIEHCDQIAFHDNCTVLEKAPDVLQVVSNM
jgi:DNA polymerase III sliding clamp (beta) subunit (PCNA family)